jgi:hypothetical protein
MRTQIEILEKIMNCVDGEPVSFMKLCSRTGFNYRTVRRHLEIIEYLQQQSPRIQILRDGFRVVIRKSQATQPAIA